MRWEAVQSEFVWEGSWRDICVSGVQPDSWRSARTAIEAESDRSEFRIEGELIAPPSDLSELLALPNHQ